MKTLRFKANKLIRDNTIDRLVKKEIKVEHYIMQDKNHFLQALKNKLVEEATEVSQTKTAEELADELGDVLEVIHVLCSKSGISFDNIEKLRLEKKQARGSFEQQIYCTAIEGTQDNPAMDYYKDRPEQYQEE